jgi:hypothetical protein
MALDALSLQACGVPLDRGIVVNNTVWSSLWVLSRILSRILTSWAIGRMARVSLWRVVWLVVLCAAALLGLLRPPSSLILILWCVMCVRTQGVLITWRFVQVAIDACTCAVLCLPCPRSPLVSGTAPAVTPCLAIWKRCTMQPPSCTGSTQIVIHTAMSCCFRLCAVALMRIFVRGGFDEDFWRICPLMQPVFCATGRLLCALTFALMAG